MKDNFDKAIHKGKFFFDRYLSRLCLSSFYRKKSP